MPKVNVSLELKDLNPQCHKCDGIVESNLLTTYQRVKIVEARWIEQGGGGFRLVGRRSGLRSRADQDLLINQGKSTATLSRHLFGLAVDIVDLDNQIKAWLHENPPVLIGASLWCEAAHCTPGWIHFQSQPPASGKRWFIP